MTLSRSYRHQSPNIFPSHYSYKNQSDADKILSILILA